MNEGDGNLYGRRSNNVGRWVLIVAVLAAIIVAILFATGFWTADVEEGAMPDVDMSVQGGELPAVNVDSKEVVVGTTEETIDVPTIGTKEETVDVPTIGVKDSGEE